MGEAATRPRPKREKTFGWRLLAGLVIPWLLLVARYRIRNGEKLPAAGAFVLAPNHYSNLDPVTTGYIVWKLGRVPRFLAKASVFRVPIIGPILRATGQIPIQRTGGASAGQSLAAAGDLVRAVRNADKANIVAARLFDDFRGQGVPEGQKSLAIEVTLQPSEKSFAEADLKAIAEKVTAAAAKLGGTLRA